MRNTFRYASKADWYELARDLRPVYTAPTEQAARERFAELAEKWVTATRRSSKTVSLTLKAGKYTFYCTVHPTVTGTFTVK